VFGLRAIGNLNGLLEARPDPFGDPKRLRPTMEALMRYQPIANIIETFWLEPANRKSSRWKEHRDINMVMLATSLAPDGFLSL
jgi:hypothetical protein